MDTDVRLPQEINKTGFGDPLTFLSSSIMRFKYLVLSDISQQPMDRLV